MKYYTNEKDKAKCIRQQAEAAEREQTVCFVIVDMYDIK